MSDSPSLMLAVGKQAHEALLQLIPTAARKELKCPTSAKRERASKQLRKLNGVLDSV